MNYLFSNEGTIFSINFEGSVVIVRDWLRCRTQKVSIQERSIRNLTTQLMLKRQSFDDECIMRELVIWTPDLIGELSW